jgi:hypothetical protein
MMHDYIVAWRECSDEGPLTFARIEAESMELATQKFMTALGEALDYTITRADCILDLEEETE